MIESGGVNPVAQVVVTSTVITWPEAMVKPASGVLTVQVPPLLLPVAVTDHLPSASTSPAFATGLVFGAVKPAGIVKVGF